MIAEAIAPPTLTELAERYGPMPAWRIRLDRFPATPDDVDDLRNTERKLYELVDGVLLEKPMGLPESFLAMTIGTLLNVYVMAKKLGIVTGADGMMRLDFDLVRIPDVAFVSWDQFPNRKVTRTPVPSIHPDLAVEVISPSNTRKEIDEKIADYFESGTTLVWIVDPEPRTVKVLTSPADFTVLNATQILDGGTLLPGFTLPVADIFAGLEDTTTG